MYSFSVERKHIFTKAVQHNMHHMVASFRNLLKRHSSKIHSNICIKFIILLCLLLGQLSSYTFTITTKEVDYFPIHAFSTMTVYQCIQFLFIKEDRHILSAY